MIPRSLAVRRQEESPPPPYSARMRFICDGDRNVSASLHHIPQRRQRGYLSAVRRWGSEARSGHRERRSVFDATCSFSGPREAPSPTPPPPPYWLLCHPARDKRGPPKHVSNTSLLSLPSDRSQGLSLQAGQVLCSVTLSQQPCPLG